MDGIIENESKELGKYQFPFFIEKVINLNKVERKIARENNRSQRKTVDSVFGVNNNGGNPENGIV